jgi:hypothetical protein
MNGEAKLLQVSIGSELLQGLQKKAGNNSAFMPVQQDIQTWKITFDILQANGLRLFFCFRHGDR